MRVSSTKVDFPFSLPLGNAAQIVLARDANREPSITKSYCCAPSFFSRCLSSSYHHLTRCHMRDDYSRPWISLSFSSFFFFFFLLFYPSFSFPLQYLSAKSNSRTSRSVNLGNRGSLFSFFPLPPPFFFFPLVRISQNPHWCSIRSISLPSFFPPSISFLTYRNRS